VIIWYTIVELFYKARLHWHTECIIELNMDLDHLDRDPSSHSHLSEEVAHRRNALLAKIAKHEAGRAYAKIGVAYARYPMRSDPLR
jgi:hypothetical protein